MKDKCVICSKETPYDETTHVDYRYGYIEGVGQICYSCYNNRNNISVHEQTVLNTPNDSDLGAFVRKLFWVKRKEEEI